MLVDPQPITYAAVVKSLVRTNQIDGECTYRLDDAGVKYNLIVGHQFKARNRVNVRLRRENYSADPLVPTQNILASVQVSFTMDFPNVGLTAADAAALAKALVLYLTDVQLLKLANGEM